MIDIAFKEPTEPRVPVLDPVDEAACDVGYEIDPGEDIFDGAICNRFLGEPSGHLRLKINYGPSYFLLQQLGDIGFIHIHDERIRTSRVRGVNSHFTMRQGVSSRYQNWPKCVGRSHLLGDGKVNNLMSNGVDMATNCKLLGPE